MTMSDLSQHTKDEITRVFHGAPFVADIGMELISFGAGECETVIRLEPRHMQQDGVVHAGVHATIADHTAGTAAVTLIRAHEMALSAEFKINLLRAAKGELLRCRAKVLKPGKQLSVVESEVYCESGADSKLVSKATVTLAILNKDRR